MFDVLEKELAQRYRLGAAAAPLIGLTLAWILAPHLGGLHGCIRRFEQHGLGPTVQSWLSRGENQMIRIAELERALDPAVLERLCARAELPRDRVLGALTALLPAAFDKLAPEGRIPPPGTVPEAVHPWLERYRDAFDDLPGTVAADRPGPAAAASGPPPWLWPALAAAALGAAATAALLLL